MKNRELTLFLLGIILLFFISCQKNETSPISPSNELDQLLEMTLQDVSNGEGKSFFTLPSSSNFEEIPQDPNNPLTPYKVHLGKMLYHETGLAIAPMQEMGEQTYSCASCHFASAGFQAGRVQGIGEGGVGFGLNGENRNNDPLYQETDIDVQPRRTPTILNGAYQKNMLWNGQFGATGKNVGTEANWTVDTPKEVNNLGFEGLEIQAIAGLAVHRLDIDDGLLNSTNYREKFDLAFPNIPESERYNRTTAGLAIAAYERTVLANQSPFQWWLKGDMNAMTDEEKNGAITFFGKAQCGSCHTGPALNTMEFYALGMNDLSECSEEIINRTPADEPDLGRGDFTQQEEDMYKFKVPQLYNLVDSPFFGHGSSFRTVRDVVAYKNLAIAEHSGVPTNQLASQFQPLNLTEEEIDNITAFIESALHDPVLARFEPENLPSGLCFPNNDEESRIDLGCQ